MMPQTGKIMELVNLATYFETDGHWFKSRLKMLENIKFISVTQGPSV